ncbi:MAG: TIGR01777 family oxidoreductase [Bacteroidia bacterium]|nr:TIGR01777 family oxidoreductase [Bacteroidia bacterium]
MNHGKVLIAGGSGLIGKHLSSYLLNKGFEVRVLSRNTRLCTENKNFYLWDPARKYIDLDALKDLNIVINLAGAGIADKRWSSERKKVLLESRIQSLECLKVNLTEQNIEPIMISASAIGIYGDRGQEELDENSDPGTGFLSELTSEWEQKAHEFHDVASKLVIIRIGIVLSTQGGALPKLRSTSGVGLYNYFGDGSAYYSWIHIDDLCEIFYQGIVNPSVNGIINGVAPNPVTNKTLIKTLKNVDRGFGIITPVPEIALKTMLGEMSCIVLDSTKVMPRGLLKSDYRFSFPDLESALKDILERKI